MQNRLVLGTHFLPFPNNLFRLLGTEDRLYYLIKEDQKLFLRKLIPGADVVDNIPWQGTQRKFEIISIIDAKKWDHFDEDRHMEGTFIAWSLKDAQVKVSVCTYTHMLMHTCTQTQTNTHTLLK